MSIYRFICLKVRDHLPLQQGLRLFFHHLLLHRTHAVRDHLPLQQGLRQSALVHSFRSNSQRPSSITTRIKTLNLNPSGRVVGQRPSSITTRIKTISGVKFFHFFD